MKDVKCQIFFSQKLRLLMGRSKLKLHVFRSKLGYQQDLQQTGYQFLKKRKFYWPEGAFQQLTLKIFCFHKCHFKLTTNFNAF